MKTAIKCMILLLALCMVVCSFAACGGGKKPAGTSDPNGSNSGTPEASKPKVTDQYGQEDSELKIDQKFDDEINILIRPSSQNVREWFIDGEPSNTLEQKIYSRNEKVSEQLDITMSFIKMKDDESATYVTDVINAYRAGNCRVDVVSSYAAYSTAAAAMECFVNLNDTERFPYFHFDQPYWNQSFRETAQVNNYLYTMVGDVNLSVFDRTCIVYINKGLASRNKIDVDSIYKTVLDGDWTYEVFYQMVVDFGRQELDNVEGATNGDLYAVTSIHGSEACDSFLQAFNLKVVEKLDEGEYRVVTGTALSNLEAGMKAVQDLFYSSNGAIKWTTSMQNYECFTGNRAVFNIDVIYHYESGLAMMRGMSDDIGMLPVPKFNGDQKNYKASVQDAHNVMSVLFNSRAKAPHYAAISALLEALCYDSYHDVRPWYFERMIKTQYVSGREDAKVFDLIINSTAWDFSDVYGANIEYARERMWRSPFKKQGTTTAAYESWAETINGKIDELMVWMEEHNYG